MLESSDSPQDGGYPRRRAARAKDAQPHEELTPHDTRQPHDTRRSRREREKPADAAVPETEAAATPPAPRVESRRERRERELVGAVAEVPVTIEQPVIEQPAEAPVPVTPAGPKSRRDRRRTLDETTAPVWQPAAPSPVAADEPAEAPTLEEPENAADDDAVVIAELIDEHPPRRESRRARRDREAQRDGETQRADVAPESPGHDFVGDDLVRSSYPLSDDTGSIPLNVEHVSFSPVVENESSEHIAHEIIAAAENTDLVPRPHEIVPQLVSIDAVATPSEQVRPFIPRPPERVLRPLPPVALPPSKAFPAPVSPSRFARSFKKGIAVVFVMAIATVFVAALSLPSLGSAGANDFAAIPAPADLHDDQSLSVGAGPALVASRDAYFAAGAPGSLYSTENPTVSKEAQAIAIQLMAAVADGRLRGSAPDHIPEIQWIAQGIAQPDCGIDLRILQVIYVALQNFDTVAVSDINRKCTGQIEGGGTASAHYVNGGGHAVDFYILNGQSVPGADANTLKFAAILDPIMPPGSEIGQAECRAAAGIKLQLKNMTEFDDTCTHMHVDVLPATGGLAIDSLLGPAGVQTALPTGSPAPPPAKAPQADNSTPTDPPASTDSPSTDTPDTDAPASPDPSASGDDPQTG